MKKIIKLIKNPKIVILYLMQKKIFHWIDDKKYLKIQYKLLINKKLNLDNPQTFNEKIQWLKLYDRNPQYTKMVDKYEVKKYVADIIGNKYIIPTLGVYEKFDDIDFEKLPNQFVIKCTHDSGGVVICKDKLKLDIKATRKKITKCLKKNYYYAAREWPYKNVKPRIIIEKYMEDESGKELKDYKVFCFNGKPKYIQVDYDRFVEHKRNIYDVNWNYQDMQILYPCDKSRQIKKPIKLDVMLELASNLSKNITFVRIDFYSIRDKIYFGEFTFHHGAGYEKFTPEEANFEFGKLINLPNIEIESS